MGTMLPSNNKLKETAKYVNIYAPSQKERTADNDKGTEFTGHFS